MSRIYNVLFLCTGNSARSILAEAILNRKGKGYFVAHSAGSFPKCEVHPAALDLLREQGYPTENFRSKSWSEFSEPGAPEVDFIFTVCDNAAAETCPVWPGKPIAAHWGVEDPAAVEGEAQRQAFWTAYRQLERRIDLFLALRPASIDKMSLANRLRAIGETDDTETARG